MKKSGGQGGAGRAAEELRVEALSPKHSARVRERYAKWYNLFYSAGAYGEVVDEGHFDGRAAKRLEQMKKILSALAAREIAGASIAEIVHETEIWKSVVTKHLDRMVKMDLVTCQNDMRAPVNSRTPGKIRLYPMRKYFIKDKGRRLIASEDRPLQRLLDNWSSNFNATHKFEYTPWRTAEYNRDTGIEYSVYHHYRDTDLHPPGLRRPFAFFYGGISEFSRSSIELIKKNVIDPSLLTAIPEKDRHDLDKILDYFFAPEDSELIIAVYINLKEIKDAIREEIKRGVMPSPIDILKKMEEDRKSSAPPTDAQPGPAQTAPPSEKTDDTGNASPVI